MSERFAENFASLRHLNGLSQRKAAEDLKISQALLSHYENGLREPRLDFVVRACDYYGVSADFMLGRDVGQAPVAAEVLSFAGKALEMIRTECGYNALHLAEEYLKSVFYGLLACEDKTDSALCRAYMAQTEAKFGREISAEENLREKFAGAFPEQYNEIKNAMEAIKAR